MASSLEIINTPVPHSQAVLIASSSLPLQDIPVLIASKHLYFAIFCKTYSIFHNLKSPDNKQNTVVMAAFTLIFAPTSAVFGRSGYNKDGDEEGQNKGRSGYNKSDDEGNDQGRSGYNKGDDDDDEGDNKGRSGYNDEEDK